MSNRPTIQLTGVGKRYTLFPSRSDGLLDALGMSWLVPHRRRRYQHFWALRGVNLTLPRGARVGIIGRNGAGKSTLLKLITGNIAPTEGTVQVDGEVQALMQTGTGMHPDFTGYENIEAALTQQGLTRSEIAAAVTDIAEFTELGQFLAQPLKTYSTGMQARLAFAAATMVKPDILIIDEVLGVGDGYFLSKSTERIQRLIDSGATVLLVSHAMEQIVRFCETALWIDRGQVVAQGDVLDVVKEYERYLRLLDERRLKSRNRSNQAGGAIAEGDPFTDALHVRFRVSPGSKLRVGAVALSENDRLQETVRVGGPQDGAVGNSAGVVLETGSGWSEPIVAGRPYRQLIGGTAGSSADVVFRLYHFDPTVRYSFDVDYQADGTGTVQVLREGKSLTSATTESAADWRPLRLECGAAASDSPDTPAMVKLHEWPGLGELKIERVRVLDAHGEEQTVFAFGGELVVEVTIQATRTGSFPACPALTIYRRSDGVMVTQQIAATEVLSMANGERRVARLRMAPINLGNETYVFSIALFKHLDLHGVDAPERHGLIDRSFEFRVFGREPHYRAVFQHPGTWEFVAAPNASRVNRSA